MNKFVVVFSRTPILGQVKTRLQPPLNETQALQCHERLLQHTLQQIQSTDYKIELWTSPTIQHPLLKQLARQYPRALHQQQGDDLGQRMFHCLLHHVAQGDRVVLIGSDCPQMNTDYVQQAFHALEDVDVVLGPAMDGGYVLIACRRINANLFEHIAWGSEQVLAQTLERIKSTGLSYRCLAEMDDIDTYADLQKYPRFLQALMV